MTMSQIDVLLEFLEVCFHTILFARKVYPSSIFTLKKKYNVPIHVSIYSDLNQYVSKVLKFVKTFLISNQLKQLSLWILDSSLSPVEKFVFNDLNVSSSLLNDERKQEYSSDLEEPFRAFCLKLSTCDYILKPLPNNSSFKIYVKLEECALKNICDDPAFEGFPWISEDSVAGSELNNIFPILSFNTSSFKFELNVEI